MTEAFMQGIGLRTQHTDAKNKTGISKYAINDRNAEKITESLCQMRGAALKIGQILSNMEDTVIPPTIKHSLERARKEADIMPKKQVIQQLEKSFGKDWHSHFKELNLYPMAAASIG